MIKWFMERGTEASTWRGLALFATSLGLLSSPEDAEAIVAAGVGLSGLIGLITKG